MEQGAMADPAPDQPGAGGSGNPPAIIEVASQASDERSDGAVPGAPGSAVPAVPTRVPPETVEQPAKVMRMGSMIKQLLEEVRLAPLDEASRARLREIYETSIRELGEGLSPDLVAELERVATPFTVDVPSQAELRVAQAQLVGWLEGLFHGIQATLFAQQMAARVQAEEAQRRGLMPRPDGEIDPRFQEPAPGTYL
ncbi:MAG TPA: bacterial proteasome activator family protein [Acidimicrobiales bacterium]|nr:bacterial proteasome activator family protein [Acidimicrobiales bacterium]